MDIPRYWRLRNQRYHLEGSQCAHCAKQYFPPRTVCPNCKSRTMSPVRFSGRGRIFSYSVVYQTSERFEGQAPYLVALIKLDDGPLITAQLTDLDMDQVQIDLPVEMVVRKYFAEGERGPIVYGYKFRPLLQTLDFKKEK